MPTQPMNYCPCCGAAVAVRVPDGESIPRHVCDTCNTTHYQNPKIVAGCIVEWQDRILLCKRAIEPRLGLWTIPAGFMENGETSAAAAARETWEEARARVEIVELHGLYNIPHIDQVYLVFRSRLQTPEFSAGPESLEVKLITESEVPWPELAFPVVRESLRLYFDDRARGRYRLHMGDILKTPSGHTLQLHDDGNDSSRL